MPGAIGAFLGATALSALSTENAASMAGVLLALATPALLAAGKTAPRTVIGSVDTSEFLVALAASIGFLIGLGSEVLDPFTIGGLLLGGVLAAPLAAWLVTKIPAPVLGSAVGGIIVLTNTQTILRALEVSENWRTTIYAFVVGLWIAAVALAISKVVRGTAPVEVVGEPTTDQPTARQEARS